MTLNITLYSRDGCHLCEQAEDDLRALQTQYPHKLAILDLDENPELEATYGFEIPVIEVGPFTSFHTKTHGDGVPVYATGNVPVAALNDPAQDES